MSVLSAEIDQNGVTNMNMRLLLLPAAVWWLCTACGTADMTHPGDAGPDAQTVPDADAPPDTQPVFPDLQTTDLSPDQPDYTQTDVCCDVSTPWEPSPCQSHNDCEDGFCLELEAEGSQFFCVPTCIEECPLDWVCKAVYLDGPDPVSVCLPPTEQTCLEQDLLFDGVDEDCDGLTDEDVALGFRLLSGRFGSGGTVAGAAENQMTIGSGNPFSGISTGGDFVLSAGVR